VDFLPALIPAAITTAKALGLGAVGYAGTKLAQKAFGDGIKKNKKKEPEHIWTRNKIDKKKGLSNI
jgi:hypothetical protein